jgi:hypothetical protein
MKNVSTIASTILKSAQRERDTLAYYEKAVLINKLEAEDILRQFVAKNKDVEDRLEDIYNIDDLIKTIRISDELIYELNQKLLIYLLKHKEG